MGAIRLLSPEVIGQIAAGEVVERASAAVKELVENSLDAEATAVTVEIRDGGVSYLRVTDNGTGIRQTELRMAFERHATSKLTTADGLVGIQTLGFRGEALASIAAVSRVTCTTRTREDVSGVKIVNEGGQILSIEEAACPVGTTMVVRDLFFNAPVRLKFLKKTSTEAGFVSDLMMRLILSRPDVSFRYINQGKTVYHSAGDGKLSSAVFSIYGTELKRNMREVSGHMNGVVVNGFVGIGEAGRGNRNHQSFFINGRYFRSPVLSAALEDACRERVMIGKFPTCVLHLTMPFELVDVNVHPNKLEVRFQNEQSVADALLTVVHEALQDRDAFEKPREVQLTPDVPQPLPVSVSKAERIEEMRPVVSSQPVADFHSTEHGTAVPQQIVPNPAYATTTAEPLPPPILHESQPLAQSYRESLNATPAPIPANIPVVQPLPEVRTPQPEEKAEQQSFIADLPKPMRIIGVLFKTYIMVEYEDQLLMIDQHAVHERLLFERFMKAFDQHEASQELMIPAVLRVSDREQALLEENAELLEQLAVTVEPIGDHEIAVRSIPMILGEPQAATFVREILDQLLSERGSVTMEKRRAAILQQACKHAVKGGETLTEADIRDLITRMLVDKVTPTCPHGRPLVIALTHTELDKRFKRIQ